MLKQEESAVALSRSARPAVYTAGYEGRSVEAFFDALLERGIRLIIDVRANPVSRRRGFSKKRLSETAGGLGIDYFHAPGLGIPREYRAGLTDFESYQKLLNKYEHEMLPHLAEEIAEVAGLMKRTPAVLVCVEKDASRCHRNRLAKAVSKSTGLEVKHI